LRISNPVRDPSLLDAGIWEQGVSRRGSSGQGLAIARRCADRIGWRLRHEVEGQRVCFIAELAEPRKLLRPPS